MLGLFGLLLLFIWIGIALAVGGLLYVFSRRRRWAFWVGTLVCLPIPVLDVIPGKILFDKAARDLAGARITQVVTDVDGYLDVNELNCAHSIYCGRILLEPSYPYRYFEMQRTEHRKFEAREYKYAGPDDEIGFYQYRIGEPGSSECANSKIFDIPREQIKPGIKEGSCIYFTYAERPVSEYQYEETRDFLSQYGFFSWHPIGFTRQRVSSTSDGYVIAEGYRIAFVPWNCTFSLFPFCFKWYAPEDPNRSDISLQKILVPRNISPATE